MSKLTSPVLESWNAQISLVLGYFRYKDHEIKPPGEVFH